MEFRQSEASLGGEVEYLAALFAFRDQVLDADQLQLAIARLISGESASILDAIRSLDSVEPVRLAAAVRMAELYCNMNGGDNQPRRFRQDAQNNQMPRLQHRPLQTDPDETIEFEDAPESTTPPVGPDYDWEQTSDWVSHFYYVEDSLRAYTGGRLGIVSSSALFVCLIAILWGAIQFQFTFFDSDSSRPEIVSATDDLNDFAGLDELADIEEGSATNDAIETAPVKTGSPEAALNVPQQVIREDREKTASEDKGVVAPSATGPSDGWLAIPTLGAVPTDQLAANSPTLAPEIADVTRSGTLIDEELLVAMTEISSGDLASARMRLTRIYNSKADRLDLSDDLRWLHLGIGVMLEQNTVESLQTASKWFRKIQADNSPMTHLLFASWLTQTKKATAILKTEMAEYFSTLSSPNSTLQTWLQAASGNHTQSIPVLEAELTKPEANRLHHFFLALAYWVANRPPEAIVQLDQLDAASIASQSPNAVTQWLTDVSWKRISATVDALRREASNAK